ncbi:MAG: hypothetical protein N3F06_03810 [Nitrososphaerales archaeon]|nr:hypothetical protein [Nitrososphaerales archaeon]
MPCYLRRIRRLPLRLRQNLAIPLGEDFERELMRELGVKTHEEMGEKIDSMSDEVFFAVINSVMKKVRKPSRKPFSEEVVSKEVPYIT